MKKIFFAIVVMANIMNIANAQTYDFSKQTAEGLAQSDSLRKVEKANASRTINFQSPDGTRSCVATDGWKGGIGVGYAYSAVQNTPVVSANVEYDGIYLWTVRREVNGQLRDVPVRILSAELNVAFSQGKYGASAASAGEKYPSYEAGLLLKFRLFEDKNLRHRLNLIGGIGYTYAKDDHVEDFGEWKDEAGDTYHLYDNVAHRGSGIFEAVGLGYSFRPFDKMGSRAELRVLATRKPQVEWKKTTPVWGFQAELVFHFGGKHYSK